MCMGCSSSTDMALCSSLAAVRQSLEIKCRRSDGARPVATRCSDSAMERAVWSSEPMRHQSAQLCVRGMLKLGHAAVRC